MRIDMLRYAVDQGVLTGALRYAVDQGMFTDAIRHELEEILSVRLFSHFNVYRFQESGGSRQQDGQDDDLES